MLSCVSQWIKLPLNCIQRGRGGNYLNGRGVRNFKVTVVGAEGGIGQPLSLLLKQNPLIEQLTLHDVNDCKGVATDLSHICTTTSVDYVGGEKLFDSLQDSQVVVVPAGLPRKPGMSRQDLLSANGIVAMTVAYAVSIACPKALLAFITNPINSIVPMAAEFLKTRDVFDPNRLFGVTTLDVVRAKTFIGDCMNIDPDMVDIPVIGGHAGTTILPLFSQCSPKLPEGELKNVLELRKRIQDAGTEVVEAKAGKGSATLSMAYAGAHFVNALLRGLNDEPNVVECSYVASNVTELPFFATPLILGPNGIKENLGLPDLDDEEQSALDNMMPLLKENIDMGILAAGIALKDAQQKQKEHDQAEASKSARIS